jgi:hypothetical protein
MKGFLYGLFFAALCFTATLLLPCDAFAQTFSPEPVEFESLVQFDGSGGVLSAIKSPLAAILAGAIGIGLAVWAARFFFGIVKSMGRG